MAAAWLGLVPEFGLENSNIAGYDEFYHLMDYNRLRAELHLRHESAPALSGLLVVDNETIYHDSDSELANDLSLHRAYLQYSTPRHLLVAGRQRIPLGVGRFWNPTDVFNPIDIEAVEVDERPGTDAIRYEYAVAELANLDLNLAEDKGAARIKGYLGGADLALLGLWDEEQTVFGWEVAGELGDTGLELRSEGGSFRERASDRRYSEFILGGDYGFASSLIVTAEYHFQDRSGHRDELGFSATMQPAMLWSWSLVTVTDLGDGSGFISPSALYSLSDEMTLTAGAFFYHGGVASYYGPGANRCYLRWFVHF
ncbi:MAG: hypothetical protein ABFR97_08285 [Thermodesulfobacteriota bacterium]